MQDKANHSEQNRNNDRKSKGRARSKASFPVAMGKNLVPDDYAVVLHDLKERIRSERLCVTLAANAAMVLLYWDLKYMRKTEGSLEQIPAATAAIEQFRKFAESWPDRSIVQRTIAQIPWRSNLALLDKLQDTNQRLWYARKTIEHGWSRDILALQIEHRLHEREGQAINNFDLTLPPADSDMATQVFRDPYLFDFLGTADPRREQEVEAALVDHIQRFLLELGAGFAFVGRQVLLEVGNRDFRLDLLFYHLKLRSFVVVELKAVPFDPGFVGQLNLYLSAVDDLLKHPDDKPTVGLLLCKSKDKLVVEYALRGFQSPMGVAQWQTQLTETLPEEFKGSLPSIEEIEAELRDVEDGQ